jgi:MinD superfamily P-loop ATPase
MKSDIKIAVASGKGGTGKTTVAVNLFYTIKDLIDNEIQLIDCDVEEPNDKIFVKSNIYFEKNVTLDIPVINEKKCIYCGRCAEFCAYNAILFIKSTRHIKVIEDLCHACGACLYACDVPDVISLKKKILGKVSKYKISDNAELIEGKLNIGEAMAVPVIKSAKKQAKKNSFVIYDSPPGTSCPVLETIHNADYVILVTEPTPFGLNDLKIMVETIKKLKLEKKMGVVINRAGLGSEQIFDYLKNENIEILMEIPFDKKIAKIYSKGEIIVDKLPEIKEKYIELFKKLMLK